MNRKSNARLGWLTSILVVLAAITIGLDNRLLTHWAYGLERGRIQANSEELARVEEVSNAFRMVAKTARPGVVHIRVSGAADLAALREHIEMQLGRRFTDEEWQEWAEEHAPVASGSGIILDGEGHILTNAHVVGGRRRIHVRLADGREFEAVPVGADPLSDLAVIKIDASDVHPLKLGDSDRVEVGDWVLAVGAPFGLSHSVTHGIISARGRRNIADVPILYQDFLQTDAAINPGNSGGPLLNLRGEVVGVNTAIATRGRGNDGIAFVIPSNMAARIAGQLKNSGEVARGWLGISLDELTDEDVDVLALKDKRGVLVDVIYEGSPAHQAGIVCEDIIVAVDATEVEDLRHLQAAIADVLPGQRAVLRVLRDGSEREIAVQVEKRPADVNTFVRGARAITSRRVDALALRVRSLRPRLPVQILRSLRDRSLAELAARHEDRRGVFVIENAPGAGDRRVDIKPGELVVGCNGRAVASVAELVRAVRAGSSGKPIRLRVLDADGERRTVTLKPD